MIDLLVRDGIIAGPGGLRRGSLLVAGGRVAGIVEGGTLPEAGQVIDAGGLLVLPGLVDSHVHFRDPGLTAKEDFVSGSRAAAAGGVTTVMIMPTDLPLTMTAEQFAEKRALGEGRSMVDFALQAAVGPDVGQVQALAGQGAVSFELFLSDLPQGVVIADAGELATALRAVAETGRVAGVTPGDDPLTAWTSAEAIARYGTARGGFIVSRPPEVEALGVATACLAARLAGAELHLRQISTALGLAAAGALGGPRVTTEATPHNLCLTDATLAALGPVAKVVPPLRAAAEVAALREALRDGRISMVATDHAPHRPAEKAAGEDDIWKAPGGFPGVQTLLAVMLRLVADGVIDHAGLVRLCCEAPARRFGLYPRKGALLPGSDADFVLVDPARQMTIRNADQQSRAGLTPFAGTEIPATPVLSALRGAVIMRDGAPVGVPAGRFLAPG